MSKLIKLHLKLNKILQKIKDFGGQNSRNLTKLNFSEIPLPYIAGKTAKKQACKPGFLFGRFSGPEGTQIFRKIEFWQIS